MKNRNPPVNMVKISENETRISLGIATERYH